MTRHRKPRSYTATDHEQQEMQSRLPHTLPSGEVIHSLSRLIVHLVLRIPKKR